MKKYEFLRELENSLKGKLSQTDINEVLSDYGDIFDNGMIEGKSEDEIAENIGSPAAISKTIIDDSEHSTVKDVYRVIKTDISNLAPMSKRLGAYLIDTFLTSLIIAVLLFASVAVYSGSTVISTNTSAPKNIQAAVEQQIQYKQRISLDKNSNVKKIELFKDDKQVFKGSTEEFDKFIEENKIDKGKIQTIETVANLSSGIPNVLAALPITLFLMFFGFSNIITAFELWIFRGYTFGKWMTKIRVIRLDGSKVTFCDALLRDAIIKSIGNSITSGILNIASFIWGCSTPEHKTVQDLAVKTKVINVAR